MPENIRDIECHH